MFRIFGTKIYTNTHLRAQRLAREHGHSGYCLEKKGREPKWIYLPECDPERTHIKVPVVLVRESIEALRYKANMEAGQSQKPDLFVAEDTDEWASADKLEALLGNHQGV